MKATFLLLICSLVACLSTAQAQSATQSITIVVIPVNELSARTQLVNMAKMEGVDGFDGEANYSIASSQPAKITAHTELGTGNTEVLWATTGFFDEPSSLSNEAVDLANGLPATLGDSLQIRYGADSQPSAGEGGDRREKATVVVLTFTN